MSSELPFSAAARQWRVFKVVGRSAVIWNVPLSGMCRYLECAVIWNVPLSGMCRSSERRSFKSLL
jgi:hypothetical protein